MENSKIRAKDLDWQNRNGYPLILDSLDSTIAAEEEIPLYLSEIEGRNIDSDKYTKILKFCSKQGTKIALADTVQDLKKALAITILFRIASEHREVANLIETANKRYEVNIGNGNVAIVDFSRIGDR